MSLVALPFAVDINRIRSVFGSKDQALLEKIKNASMYDNYASQGDDHEDEKYNYNLDQALEDIVFRYERPADRKAKTSFWSLKKVSQGSGLNDEKAIAYGYAMLVICDALGAHLLPECDGFYYGRDFEAAIAIIRDAGLGMDLGDMFEQHEVFDIPKNNDFPAIKLFTKQEIEHVNEVMARVYIDERSLDYDTEYFDEVQELLFQIKRCFQTCREQELDLVTFAH